MWLSRGDSNPGLFLSPRFQPPLHSVGSSLPRWRALVQGLGRFWNLCEDVPGGGGGGAARWVFVGPGEEGHSGFACRWPWLPGPWCPRR